ncbi:unnamed protein product [Phytomonas sp. EM1]|nr:unnamed protein product [Phytomonas sp. EM1]|eukprot:CCW61684.1 unnamed protein product [Phytomonas sp. isolate EM1]
MFFCFRSNSIRISKTLFSSALSGAIRAHATKDSSVPPVVPSDECAGISTDLHAKKPSDLNVKELPQQLENKVGIECDFDLRFTVDSDDSFRDNRARSHEETVEHKRRRLIYQSQYRGMVEMDLIFGHFARCKVMTLPDELLDEYDILLRQLDNDLFQWLVMNLTPPDDVNRLKCFHELKKFLETEKKELLGSF